VRLLAGTKPSLASCPQVAAGGDRWLLMAVRGHPGDTHAKCVGQVLGGAAPGARPSVFKAWHIPSWRGSSERYALSPVVAVRRWLLLLLSPLLSAGLRGTGGRA
jgi:hypothetical protein